MRLLVAALSVALFASCGSSSEAQREGGPEMSALGTEEGEGGTVVEKYDLNGDQRPDLWKVYHIGPSPDDPDKTVRTLVRKEMDLNFDGKLDIRQFLDENGVVYREEMDLDFDGHIDAVAYYKDGQLIKRELDLTFDGRPDIFKYYEDGKLVRKERASGRDGRIDIWEYFEAGRLVRIGRDRDGDGRPEVFDDAPEQEPELPGGAPGG